MRHPHILMQPDIEGRWRYFRVAGNGRTTDESETRYTTRRSCRRAALRDWPGLPIIIAR